MHFPFTTDQFLNVFKSYNDDIFPLQVVFYLTGFFIVFLLFKTAKIRDKIITALLSFFWIWMGIVYQMIFFSKINNAAYTFGILFIIQGFVFFIYGNIRERVVFQFNGSIYNYAGIFFILYALIIYPVLGYIFGHRYPYSPTFGLPCPTTIFTFGVLLFLKNKISVWILIIPFMWSIIGFGAALNLSIYEDFGLLVAGLSGLYLLIMHNRKVLYSV
jgi:Family of unknown function (DUF6064)